MLDHAAKEVRGIELALGGVLNPGDDDVDEEQCEKKLKRVWLDRRTVFKSSGIKLACYSDQAFMSLSLSDAERFFYGCGGG